MQLLCRARILSIMENHIKSSKFLQILDGCRVVNFPSPSQMLFTGIPVWDILWGLSLRIVTTLSPWVNIEVVLGVNPKGVSGKLKYLEIRDHGLQMSLYTWCFMQVPRRNWRLIEKTRHIWKDIWSVTLTQVSTHKCRCCTYRCQASTWVKLVHAYNRKQNLAQFKLYACWQHNPWFLVDIDCVNVNVTPWKCST